MKVLAWNLFLLFVAFVIVAVMQSNLFVMAGIWIVAMLGSWIVRAVH